MTSTSFNIGLEGQARNSSKVLKPPGGGSSDIFGSDAELPRARNTNHLQSSVFSNMMETTASKSKLIDRADIPNAALFGNECAAAEVNKNDALGHSFFDAEENLAEAKEEPETVLAKVDEADKPILVERVLETKEVGNPVTGEGYAIANGVKEMAAAPVAAAPAPSRMTNGSAPKTNGTAQVAAAAPASTPSRGRVPPGGYSSGLW